MTIEEALEKVNSLPFPEVKEGDNVKFAEYWFKYQNGKWVIDESKI
jgi:hypothetical protein